MSSTDKYLALYAEDEVHRLDFLQNHRWRHTVVIPACRESAWLGRCFTSLKSAAKSTSGGVLAILVLNGDTEDAAAALDSLALQLLEVGPAPLSLCSATPSLGVLCINRTGRYALPAKQGVGLARKIGCDAALSLFHRGQLLSSVVHTTDADVQVPSDYFQIPSVTDAAAYLYPFEHRFDEGDTDEAHALYERFLQYYVDGLKAAGSPYAFHTVGSTMVLSLPHYALIRGFPRREAAEDFYVLNKLAKVGRILSLPKPHLRITPRGSDRVPFGTGQATGKLREQLAREEPYRVYDARVFESLTAWLSAAEAYCDTRDDSMLEHAILPFGEVIQLMGGIQALRIAWKTRSTPQDRRRHFHTWFDGFKTLRFIHLLTERYFPKVPIEEALERGEKLPAF